MTNTLPSCAPTRRERFAGPRLEPEAGTATGELISMNAHRITPLAAALALAVAPVAAGANAPRGSHGQETDKPGAAQTSTRCAGSSTTVLAGRSTAFAAPGAATARRPISPRVADHPSPGVHRPVGSSPHSSADHLQGGSPEGQPRAGDGSAQSAVLARANARGPDDRAGTSRLAVQIDNTVEPPRQGLYLTQIWSSSVPSWGLCW